MTEEELKALVPEDQHADFDTLVTELKTHEDPLADITDEGFVELLKGNTAFTKVHDGRVQAGIKTWQENNLDKIYTERYSKENPDDTDDQKRIKALEIENAEGKRVTARATSRIAGMELLNAAKMPPSLIDHCIDDDPKLMAGKIGVLKGEFETREKAAVEAFVKANGRDVETGDLDSDKYLSIDAINQMTPTEQGQNEERISESLAYHYKNQSPM